MIYQQFVDAIKQQDSRNKFDSPGKSPKNVPKALEGLFNFVNPVDVEITLKDMTAIRLYSAEELESLQNAYQLGDQYFVFATREGDPIAVNGNAIVTCAHGRRQPRFEVLADNLEEYLKIVLKEMRISSRLWPI